MNIEIMDTTLRDGEQTHGISFSPLEKKHLAVFLLKDLGVDRIEVASARVSSGEFEAVQRITEWAAEEGYLDQIEVLGFVDGNRSLDWIRDAGAKTFNLLCKGSLNHVKKQLRKTPEEHLNDISILVKKANQLNITVNIYLEDWSNGMRHSPEYVDFMLKGLTRLNVKRFMLPDTLGILNPRETFDFCEEIIRSYPGKHFDFHAHNDYDLAVANVFAAVRAGIRGIHTTVNGLGERAGNAPLASIIALLNDQIKVKNSVNEKALTKASKLVESFSGIRIPNSKPVIGAHVFTQTAGVHADGDSKDHLYYNDLLPERFGRKRKYALGKLSGKANIEKNLEELGLNLNEESLAKVTRRIIELGDKKEYVSTEDLPYIIADVLDKSVNFEKHINIRNYALSLSKSMKPVASIEVEIDGEVYEETAFGDGQYDAFMHAMWKIYKKLDKATPRLLDYQVTIPPGGNTNALVETKITWQYENREFVTRGLDADQTEAAIQATEKVFNLIESVTLYEFASKEEIS